MWLRRGERGSRRGDSADLSFDLSVRVHGGGAGRRVRVSARDADGDAPAGFRLCGEDVVLRLHDGRIVLREARDRRGAARLSVPVESCVSAAVDEVRAADGSARLRLELQVEFATFVREPLSFSLLFPTTCRHRLAELIHLISWSVSPLPLAWRRDDLPSDDTAPPGGTSAVEWPPDDAEVPVTPTPPPELPPAAVPEPPAQCPGGNTTPAFGVLEVTGVPDTGDWVSFHPLPASSEVFTYRSRANAGLLES